MECKTEILQGYRNNGTRGRIKNDSGNPIADDILIDGDLNEHFLNTSSNLLSRFIRKRIPLMMRPCPQLPKSGNHADWFHNLPPKNKRPFSTSN
jgi:hypothetical protein